MLDIRKPVWLLGLAFILLIGGLGSWGLTESSEARYAEIGREMYRSGDYLHPTDLGIRHYHKPPVTYYLTSLGYAIFGVNEFGARFFLAVAFTLQLLLIWKISLLLFNDRKMALASAVAYFSIPLALLSGRILTTDAYLNTCALASVFFFVHHRLRGQTWSLYAFYLAWGLGFLTKGPAVLIPIGAFIASWKVIRRESIFFSIHSVLAGLLCVLLSGSWYLMVSLDNPNFLEYFVGEQIFNRAVSASDLHRAKPIWYYLLLAPLVGLPWLPFGFSAWLGSRGKANRQAPGVRIVAFTALAVLAFYSVISSKLIFYVLPMFPYVALLAGYYLFRVPEKGLKALSGSLLGLTGLLVIGVGILPWVSNLGRDAAEGLLFVIFGAGILLWLVRRFPLAHPNRILGLSVLLGLQIIWGYALVAAANPYTIHTYRELAAKVRQLDPAHGRPVVAYNFWVPSIAFYRNQPFTTVKAGNQRIQTELQFEQDTLYRANLIDTDLPGEEARLLKKIRQERPIMIFLENDSIPKTIKRELTGAHTLELYHKYLIYF